VFVVCLCQCILAYENKYGERVSDETILHLGQAMYETRRQIKAAFDRRVEVLNNIRHSPKQPGDTRPYPRETVDAGGQASLQSPTLASTQSIF